MCFIARTLTQINDVCMPSVTCYPNSTRLISIGWPCGCCCSHPTKTPLLCFARFSKSSSSRWTTAPNLWTRSRKSPARSRRTCRARILSLQFRSHKTKRKSLSLLHPRQSWSVLTLPPQPSTGLRSHHAMLDHFLLRCLTLQTRPRTPPPPNHYLQTADGDFIPKSQS